MASGRSRQEGGGQPIAKSDSELDGRGKQASPATGTEGLEAIKWECKFWTK
jgi:hypothetical protein